MDAAKLAGRRVEAIVIGASAGGIEALTALLPALPAGATVAVFVVLHLPRSGSSLLVEIFTPRCALRVEEAMDKQPVRAGSVCFAPPDYHLLIERDTGTGTGTAAAHRIALSIDEPVHHSRPSIDVLFESAADVFRERLLGIVLTGGNEDGAAGLAAVQAAGGLTAVQDPEEAQVRRMPDSALERIAPDFVLPLAGLAELLSTVAVEAAP